jgi:hypothetical protein
MIRIGPDLMIGANFAFKGLLAMKLKEDVDSQSADIPHIRP